MSPDGVPVVKSEAWVDCCIEHDLTYWLGGSVDDKERADDKLRECMKGRGYSEIGHLYRAFVREFGGPKSSHSFRWGYGWNYRRTFGTLTESEAAQVQRVHGVERSGLSQALLTEPIKIVRSCDTFDVGLRPVSTEEKLVYQYLNSRLLKDEIIEWAKSGYFNLEKKQILVKLESCEKPIVFEIQESTSRKVTAKGDCPTLPSR